MSAWQKNVARRDQIILREYTGTRGSCLEALCRDHFDKVQTFEGGFRQG